MYKLAKEPKVSGTINAKGTEISVISSVGKNEDYISLTDIARYRNSEDPAAVIGNWMRNRNTIEFLGLWEELNNTNFKPLEFEEFKNESGSNAFTLSPQKWISSTKAIGIISKSGRYGGGTFAHTDIAFEFASWISPEFKLYIIKDYQRLKADEGYRLALDWNVKRVLAKANYQIHTDAIKDNLIPKDLPVNKKSFIYADEADVLNMALFGKTAKQWRIENPKLEGNMRDHATIEQLIVMVNLESMNAVLIEQNVPQWERLNRLRKIAVDQLQAFLNNKSVHKLNEMHNNLKLSEID